MGNCADRPSPRWVPLPSRSSRYRCGCGSWCRGAVQRPPPGGLLGRLARAADGQASTQSIAGVRRPEHAAAPVTAGQVPGQAGSTSQLDTALPPCAASGQLVRPWPGVDRGALVVLPVAVRERAGGPAVHAGDPSFRHRPSIHRARAYERASCRSPAAVSSGDGCALPVFAASAPELPGPALPGPGTRPELPVIRCQARHQRARPANQLKPRRSTGRDPGTDDHRSQGRSTRTVRCSRLPSGRPRCGPADAAGSRSCRGRAGQPGAASRHPRRQGAATGHGQRAGRVTRRWHPGEHRC